MTTTTELQFEKYKNLISGLEDEAVLVTSKNISEARQYMGNSFIGVGNWIVKLRLSGGKTIKRAVDGHTFRQLHEGLQVRP